MKKRKLMITLITNDTKEEYNLLGEYDEERKIITYRESKSLLTEVKLDLKKKTLIRNNNDYYLEYKFIENEETENKIKLKDLNQSIFLKIKTGDDFISVPCFCFYQRWESFACFFGE